MDAPSAQLATFRVMATTAVDASTQTEWVAFDANLKDTPWLEPCMAHEVSCCGLCYETAQDEAEQSKAVVLRQVLSTSDIESIIESGTQVLPHLCDLAEQCGGPCAGLLCPELEGQAHDTAFTEKHILLNLHRDGFFQDTSGPVCKRIVDSMTLHGTCMPLSSAAWQAKCASPGLALRCVELHTYAPGGALVAPGHRDNGSVLSMSVLLNSDFEGGSFVTYTDRGAPIVHSLHAGDAVLFLSEKTHNVNTLTDRVHSRLHLRKLPISRLQHPLSTCGLCTWRAQVRPVISGIRRSLVVELWAGQENCLDRFR